MAKHQSADPATDATEALIERGVAWHADAADALSGGRAVQARRLAERALRALEETLGPDSLDVANVHMLRARIALTEGRMDDALLAAERAHALTRGARGDADVATLRLNGVDVLAEVRRSRGDLAGAAKLLQGARAATIRAFGIQSLEVARLENHRGIVAKFRGRYAEAARHYAEALAIYSTQPEGPASPIDPADLAGLHHNLGGLAHARNRPAEGLASARKALEIRRALHGDEHPDVAADASALAALLDQLDERVEAEALYRQALATFERTLGPGHFEVAFNLGNLGALLDRIGRKDEALPLYQKAVKLKRRWFGGPNWDLALTLNNLAVHHDECGRGREAVATYTEALAMLTETLGAEHPHTKACAANLAGLKKDGGGKGR